MTDDESCCADVADVGRFVHGCGHRGSGVLPYVSILGPFSKTYASKSAH